jgi:Ca2+-binding EF-hand superfamily protein
LKEHRLAYLRKLKQEQLDQEAVERKKREEEEKLRKTRFLRAAQQAKQNIRAVKDASRNFQNDQDLRMDEEEMKMAKNIREKNKENSSKVEAIKDIKVTITNDQAIAFQQENDFLHSKGLPYFVKIERSIGRGIFFWVQYTFDDSLFITDLALAHKDVENEYYADLTKQKYEPLDIDTIPLRIWLKRSKHRSKGLKDIKISFTEQEENQYANDKYERMEPNLVQFELPESILWFYKVDKTKKSTALNTDAIISEYKKVKDMIITAQKKNKQVINPNLRELYDKVLAKLQLCYEKEKQNIVTNPLQSAIDLMALDQDEIDAFIEIFSNIDKDKKGKISISDFFEFVRETPTTIAQQLFITLDSLDDQGFIEFGDFVRTLGTYCFFGKEDILRFIYIFADQDRSGELSGTEFQELVDILHPYEKQRAKQALKMMQWKPTNTYTFPDFIRLNEEYPALFNPMFLLQNSMRERTLGVDWWFRKLSKYQAVRQKMAMEGDKVQEVVELELQRYQEDKDKHIRLQQREALIEKEDNALKKTYLQAKQFWDMIS